MKKILTCKNCNEVFKHNFLKMNDHIYFAINLDTIDSLNNKDSVKIQCEKCLFIYNIKKDDAGKTMIYKNCDNNIFTKNTKNDKKLDYDKQLMYNVSLNNKSNYYNVFNSVAINFKRGSFFLNDYSIAGTILNKTFSLEKWSLGTKIGKVLLGGTINSFNFYLKNIKSKVVIKDIFFNNIQYKDITSSEIGFDVVNVKINEKINENLNITFSYNIES